MKQKRLSAISPHGATLPIQLQAAKSEKELSLNKLAAKLGLTCSDSSKGFSSTIKTSKNSELKVKKQPRLASAKVIKAEEADKKPLPIQMKNRYISIKHIL